MTAGDYPDVGDPTAARWTAALEALDASHAWRMLPQRPSNADRGSWTVHSGSERI